MIWRIKVYNPNHEFVAVQVAEHTTEVNNLILDIIAHKQEEFDEGYYVQIERVKQK